GVESWCRSVANADRRGEVADGRARGVAERAVRARATEVIPRIAGFVLLVARAGDDERQGDTDEDEGAHEDLRTLRGFWSQSRLQNPCRLQLPVYGGVQSVV